MRTIMLIVLTALATAWIPVTSGQTVSLTSAEQTRLRQIIAGDRDAQALLNGYLRHTGDEAKASSPNPIERIAMEGKLESDPAKVASHRSLEDMNKVQALALMYAATQDDSYAKAAREYVVAWAKVNKPTGDPIDETQLEPLLFGYDLVRPTMSGDDRDKVDHWLREVASKTLAYHDPKAWTNWNSHRIKIVGMIAFILQDRDLIDQSVSLYKKQIENNLQPDGSSMDFHERDAVSYHAYDIWPLLTFATVAKRNGMDLYDYVAPNGASLSKAVEFLRPFAEGRQTHAEFVHSAVPMDIARSAHKEAGHVIGDSYKPKQATGPLESAAYFDPSLGDLSRKIRGTSSKYPSIQMLLNAVWR